MKRQYDIPKVDPAFVVSGLNGALPIAYDDKWQTYIDLSQEQIAAFQAFPEWGTKVAAHNAFLQSKNLAGGFSARQISGTLPVAKPVAGLTKQPISFRVK